MFEKKEKKKKKIGQFKNKKKEKTLTKHLFQKQNDCLLVCVDILLTKKLLSRKKITFKKYSLQTIA